MATKKDKLRNQLKAASRRRAKRPTPTALAPVSLKANGNLERRMARDHQDVLQNVEFALVKAAQDADEIDDSVVEQILRLAIQDGLTEDATLCWALDYLATLRQQRDDISDDVWRDALRVVYTSLKRHSSCLPGELSYLAFVAHFIR